MPERWGGEDRVRTLMEHLESSVAAAKKARDAKRRVDHEQYQADMPPDEWDAAVASAVNGSSDDYSHLDGDDDDDGQMSTHDAPESAVEVVRWAGRRIVSKCVHEQPLDSSCGACEYDAWLAFGAPEAAEGSYPLRAVTTLAVALMATVPDVSAERCAAGAVQLLDRLAEHQFAVTDLASGSTQQNGGTSSVHIGAQEVVPPS